MSHEVYAVSTGLKSRYTNQELVFFESGTAEDKSLRLKSIQSLTPHKISISGSLPCETRSHAVQTHRFILSLTAHESSDKFPKYETRRLRTPIVDTVIDKVFVNPEKVRLKRVITFNQFASFSFTIKEFDEEIKKKLQDEIIVLEDVLCDFGSLYNTVSDRWQDRWDNSVISCINGIVENRQQ